MSEGTPGFRIRLLADKEGPVQQFTHEDGSTVLVHTETREVVESWPLAGVRFEGEPPDVAKVPTSWVQRGVAEGWLTLENPRPVAKPGGPPENPWRPDKVHNFMHGDAIVLYIVDGDHRYFITHQPDKYDDDQEPSGTRVDHFYIVQREG